MMRWEEGKKWQKKISVLQNKLTEKSKQLEAAQKQLTTLKDLQSRHVLSAGVGQVLKNQIKVALHHCYAH